jgi:periplasmic divalent cation tolerance protein
MISGVRSMYWWEGEIQVDEECIILMETTEAKRASALEALERLHPYDVPKILHWAPEGNDDYTSWLEEVTKR